MDRCDLLILFSDIFTQANTDWEITAHFKWTFAQILSLSEVVIPATSFPAILYLCNMTASRNPEVLSQLPGLWWQLNKIAIW